MKHEGHLEIYRVAFESANSELEEISAEVERLQIRKDQIERLVTVLKPLIDEGEEMPSLASIQSLEQTDEFKEPASEGNSQSESFTADPFQRRTDHILGIGAGIRDVRKYSRQF
jgi:hypothetical protein